MRSFPYAPCGVLLLLLAAACAPPAGTPRAPLAADLPGNWYSNEWQSYHSLIFSGRSVFVDNNIDSVFTLEYALSGDTLRTRLAGGPWIPRRIRLLSPDSLVLDGVHDNPEQRRYSRVDRDFGRR